MPPSFSNSVTLFVTFSTICWFKARASWWTLKKASVIASVNFQIDRVLDFYVCLGFPLIVDVAIPWGGVLGYLKCRKIFEQLHASISASWVWISHGQSASHSCHASPPLPSPPCHYGRCLSGAVIQKKPFLLHIALVMVFLT